MHTDHEALFSWVLQRFPGGRLYGPYEHGGRRYYQWMARGPFLRQRMIPLLDVFLRPEHSGRVYARYEAMKARYRLSGADPDPGGQPRQQLGKRLDDPHP
jgi:hypothetical protein